MFSGDVSVDFEAQQGRLVTLRGRATVVPELRAVIVEAHADRALTRSEVAAVLVDTIADGRARGAQAIRDAVAAGYEVRACR